MRVERWYWLAIVCGVVSLLIHGGIIYNSRNFHTGCQTGSTPAMVEVTLAPPDEPIAPPVKQAEIPKVEVQPEEKTKPEPPKEDANVPLADIAPPAQYRPPVKVRLDEPEEPLQKEPPIVQPDEKVVVKPNAEPGGELPDKDEKPLPLGSPNRPRSNEAMRTPKAILPQNAGGSEAPSVVLGGKGGANAPDSPPEDVVYNGGGAGGDKLPKEVGTAWRRRRQIYPDGGQSACQRRRS